MDTHVPYLPPIDYAKKFCKNIDEVEALTLNSYFILKYRYGEKIASIFEKKMYRKLLELYDACIKYLDEHICELIEFLEDKRILENSIIVIFSDHGDEHLEHGGYAHEHCAYNEVVRVFLSIKFPDGKASFYNSNVQLLD